MFDFRIDCDEKMQEMMTIRQSFLPSDDDDERASGIFINCGITDIKSLEKWVGSINDDASE